MKSPVRLLKYSTTDRHVPYRISTQMTSGGEESPYIASDKNAQAIRGSEPYDGYDTHQMIAAALASSKPPSCRNARTRNGCLLSRYSMSTLGDRSTRFIGCRSDVVPSMSAPSSSTASRGDGTCLRSRWNTSLSFAAAAWRLCNLAQQTKSRNWHPAKR